MTLGSGIALAAVWLGGCYVITDKNVTGIGMFLMIIALICATSYIVRQCSYYEDKPQ